MLIKRETKTGGNSLGIVYRPCTVDELVGNTTNKKLLKNYLDNGKLPHTLLFSGDSGCGKTSAARIVALGINCTSIDKPTSTPCTTCDSCKAILGGYSMDVMEYNVGKDGGKADISEIVDNLPSAPFSSRAKIVIFDEAHKLTAAAKDLLLKEIEDGYSHVYFIFCTNQAEELKSKKKGGDPFLGRCAKMQFGPLPKEDISTMLVNVLEFEGQPYNDDVLTLIVEETKGVPRDALVALSDIINEGSWTKVVARSVLGGIVEEDNPAVIDLSRALMAGKWAESCKLYAKLSNTMAVESTRIAVTGWFVACLKRSNKFQDARKFSAILDVLIDPIYLTGKPAENIFYHKMFKVVDLIKNFKGA